MTFLGWLHNQVTVMAGIFGDVTSNKPAPARQVAEELFYALAASVAAWTIARTVSKAVKH